MNDAYNENFTQNENKQKNPKSFFWKKVSPFPRKFQINEWGWTRENSTIGKKSFMDLYCWSNLF